MLASEGDVIGRLGVWLTVIFPSVRLGGDGQSSVNLFDGGGGSGGTSVCVCYGYGVWAVCQIGETTVFNGCMTVVLSRDRYRIIRCSAGEGVVDITVSLVVAVAC